jgi:hypothetical protein
VSQPEQAALRVAWQAPVSMDVEAGAENMVPDAGPAQATTSKAPAAKDGPTTRGRGGKATSRIPKPGKAPLGEVKQAELNQM